MDAVFGDVGDPTLVLFGSDKVPVDHIRSRVTRIDQLSSASGSGKPCQTGSAHQHRHRTASQCDAVPHGELGVDSIRPVGTPKVDVDLADHVGQPDATDRPGQRRTTLTRTLPTLDTRSAPEDPPRRNGKACRPSFTGLRHHRTKPPNSTKLGECLPDILGDPCGCDHKRAGTIWTRADKDLSRRLRRGDEPSGDRST